MSDLTVDEKKAALIKFWVARWKKNREIAVFSHTEEASDSGLPTLSTMSELARRVSGVNVVHYGFGCFGAKTYKGEEIFGFCGGGAMQQDPAIDCSYTILTIRKVSRRLVIKILREIAPGGWEEIAKRKEVRRKAREDKEDAVEYVAGLRLDLLMAAEAVLATPGAIGLGESMAKLQRVVDDVRAFCEDGTDRTRYEKEFCGG